VRPVSPAPAIALIGLRARHVKQLESRSLLLDTALASADEANRRWEECRGVLDGLRAENAQLRADNARLRVERRVLAR
jgi:exonuclease VII small subunit